MPPKTRQPLRVGRSSCATSERSCRPTNPILHLTLESATALPGADPVNREQAAAQALSNELIGELKAADVVVIGAPMYNFEIPSTLKAWFDYVLRTGLTFCSTESGPESLATGKRAIVAESRGGLYSEGPAQPTDPQEPHLRIMLDFIGITDVTFVRAERLAFGPEVRDQAIGGAKAEIARVTGTALAAAA